MRRPPISAIVLGAGLLPAAGLAAAPAGPAVPRDIHSRARPEEVRVVHMDIDWTVSFDEKALQGSVVLHLKRSAAAPGGPLRLDTRDLRIVGVTAGPAGGAMAKARWSVGPRDPILGAEMTVELPSGADRVKVEYRTSPEASGLQWLAPEQTAGGRHPFLYSQAQAIHARSFLPCQDSPAVRATFDATVRVKPPLRAVMAAERAGESEGAFRFKMPYAIPAYLIAIGVGDLAFGETGPRTGVWAEPPVLAKALHEFADTEKMVQAAERLYGPYRWGRYDLLILPPSFPFGGMENPLLTFATPTVLAGDRSLVALVAHELAHSWSGNLVTNATWSDFWLNEGFTTYIERRIMEEIYGGERASMEWMLGREDLEKIFEELKDKPRDQALRIPLEGRDPDDAAMDVPYDKGSLLLRQLEETYGRAAFDPFLRSWFDEHAFGSVGTDQFVAFAEERLFGKHRPVGGAAKPDLAAWIDRPGLPPSAPRVASDALARVDAAARAWSEGRTPAKGLDTGGWTTHHWLHFLHALPKTLTPDRMKELDDAFGFTATGNSEVLADWLVLAARQGYAPADSRLERFLTSQGRRKYLKPIYQELVKTEAGRRRALEIYAKARPLYHTIARKTLDEIVKPAGS